ncbi:hypothetical protein IKZ80_01830 [bacterium]|nr:hypothetical protein [bacterium]
MKIPKLIFWFLAAVFVLSLDARGAGAAEWKKAFEGDKFKSHEFAYFDFFYPEKCMAPGAKVQSSNDPFYDTEDKIDRYKADLRAAEEEKLDIEAQIAWLDDEEEEALKAAKGKLTAAEGKIKRLKSIVASLDPAFAEKEGIDAKKLAAEIKDEDAKKKAKQAKEFHEEDTFKYYKMQELNEGLENIFRDTVTRLGCEDAANYTVSHAKIYFVTDPKEFAKLKGNDHLTPVKVAYIDRKARSVLVFVSPKISKRLVEYVGFAVSKMILEEHMAISNPKGELCDAFKIGFSAWCSGLNAVVEPNKILEPEYLLENKLLLPSELFLPSKLEDPEKRLYFTRQSKAVVEYIFSASKEKFQKYVETVSGGNSGFRNSFQNLYVSKTWADSYDDFCNDLNFRIFFPLTKEAKDPEALAEWNKAIADEDASASSGTDKPKKLRKQIKINHGYKRIIYK